MKTGVVGLGAMGIGIVQVLVEAGHEVIGTDAGAAGLASAPGRLAGALARKVARGKLSEAEAQAAQARFRTAPGIEGLAPAGLVIEAVVEDPGVKRAVFAALEEAVAPGAVLASNTSSLPLAPIAAGLRHPSRFLGLHFFNPAPLMRLVELIPMAGTDPQLTAMTRALVEAAGKTVVLAPDRPGFIVNRCARPFYGEALSLLAEGRQAAEIDAAMLAAGYPLGPLSLIDLVGADINLAATRSLSAAMEGHPRYHVFAALEAAVAEGRLGNKTGAGFIAPGKVTAAEAPRDAGDIAARIEACLINEAAWLLSEGAVSRADVDTALTLGLNFPAGPFALLQRRGAGEVLATLGALETRAPEALRGRYLPPELLSRAA